MATPLFNRMLKPKIALEIIDLKDLQGEAKGTRVVFGQTMKRCYFQVSDFLIS